MGIHSEVPLARHDEIPPRKGEDLDAPLTGTASDVPLPAWARNGRRAGRVLVWDVRKMGIPTAEQAAFEFPEAFAEAGGEAGMPRCGLGGPDYRGRDPFVVWDEYCRALGNRQIAIDAAQAGTLMVTTGALKGEGRLPEQRCPACGAKGVSLVGDRCAGGCKP